MSYLSICASVNVTFLLLLLYIHPFIHLHLSIGSYIHQSIRSASCMFPYICIAIHRFIYKSIYPSVQVSAHSYNHPFICPPIKLFISISPSNHPFIHQSFHHPVVCLSIHLSIYHQTDYFIHLSVHPFIHLSGHLIVYNCLSIYPSIYP